MTSSLPSGALAYLVKEFPVVSETFILNEILGLEERDVPVAVFSLRPPDDERMHRDVSRVQAPVEYVPEFRSASMLEAMRVLTDLGDEAVPGLTAALAIGALALARL